MSSDQIVSILPAYDRQETNESIGDNAIHVSGLSKCYQVYDTPRDRLKQFFVPRLRNIARQRPRQYFREFWALKDVSFEIMRGETVGIVGRNGSGKSTLLQLICGTLTPTSGTVETSGRVAALLELGSGFSSEFTGRENVYLNAAVLGLSKEEVDARFDDIAAFADIGPFMDQPVKTYSSGMVVRLAFSVAINVDPQILVVDEALSVGDELFQRKCFSRIESLKKAGATILFVSHSGTTVTNLCDRAILLDSGGLLAVGSPKFIVSRYQRLLYASEDKYEAIRGEIKDASRRTQLSRNLIEEPQKVNCAADSRNQSTIDFYDPYLKPTSTVSYESRGALISSPQVLNRAGQTVNCLESGSTYRYVYDVQFKVGASNVLLGMLIKAVSGIELGGASSAPSSQEAIPYIAPGTRFHAEFSFKCNLNPGIYFINAGVVGVVNETEMYLHRILDACVFRVLPRTSISSGAIDFECTHELRECD